MAAATTASSGGHDHGDRRDYDCAWRDIGTAYAVEVTMPARAAPAGHGHSQLGSRLFKGRSRHCLSGRNTKKADSDEQTERKYSGHAFLLWFWVVPRRSAPFESLALSLWQPITTTNKLSRFHKANKRMASTSCRGSQLIQQRVTVISRVPPLSEGTVLTSLVVWQVSAAGGCET